MLYHVPHYISQSHGLVVVFMGLNVADPARTLSISAAKEFSHHFLIRTGDLALVGAITVDRLRLGLTTAATPTTGEESLAASH